MSCPPEELMLGYGMKFEGSLVLDISDSCQTSHSLVLLSMIVSNNVTWKQYMLWSELMFTASYQCESCKSVLLLYEISVLNKGREHSVLIVGISLYWQ